jgi:hypothetical protein
MQNNQFNWQDPLMFDSLLSTEEKNGARFSKSILSR